MANIIDQNQILPFFYTKGLPENTYFNYKRFTADGYIIFIFASLYSQNISDLDEYLSLGINCLIASFLSDKSEILERMRKAIFDSGDRLADFLIEQKLPVDDVDYSVCLIAFKEGVFYLWIDGDLNLRIYRGNESLLVNEKHNPQFYGSALVETGDILAVSLSQFLENEDKNVEDYVLEKAEPDYPLFLLDYQIDNDLRTLTHEEGIITSNSVKMDSIQQNSFDNVKNLKSLRVLNFYTEIGNKFIGKLSQINLKEYLFKLQNIFHSIKNKIDEYKFIPKSIDVIKKLLQYAWSLLMSVTSVILDFIFGIVYRNNLHKFRRFQSSVKKVQLQYLLILIILLSFSYFVLFSLWRPANTGNNSSSDLQNTDQKQIQLKSELQEKYDLLTRYVTTSQIDKFNQQSIELKALITIARNQGFKDTQYLDQLVLNIEGLEDKIYKVTPITKVDEVFSVNHIPNADLADFSRIGTTVYAIDRANAQILVSNSATQQFDIFAKDEELVAMTHISCLQKSCYIIDEKKGIVILNLETKTFSKFSALKDAGRGVKELATYLAENTVYIYTLLPSEGKVLRYQRVGEGLSQPEVWNKVPGFGENVTDILVDGGIYEISNDGTLRRFFNRNVEPVTNFAGLGTALLPLQGNLQIAATPPRDPAPGVVNRFYVADSVNQRVAVFDRDLDANKKLTFLGSYKFRGTDRINFGSFKEISLSADEKFLYCLSNNIVFKFSVSSI